MSKSLHVRRLHLVPHFEELVPIWTVVAGLQGTVFSSAQHQCCAVLWIFLKNHQFWFFKSFKSRQPLGGRLGYFKNLKETENDQQFSGRFFHLLLMFLKITVLYTRNQFFWIFWKSTSKWVYTPVDNGRGICASF
jgi:hypothetical protein